VLSSKIALLLAWGVVFRDLGIFLSRSVARPRCIAQLHRPISEQPNLIPFPFCPRLFVIPSNQLGEDRHRISRTKYEIFLCDGLVPVLLAV
jgi:hypothetical protein